MRERVRIAGDVVLLDIPFSGSVGSSAAPLPLFSAQRIFTALAQNSLSRVSPAILCRCFDLVMLIQDDSESGRFDSPLPQG